MVESKNTNAILYSAKELIVEEKIQGGITASRL